MVARLKHRVDCLAYGSNFLPYDTHTQNTSIHTSLQSWGRSLDAYWRTIMGGAQAGGRRGGVAAVSLG
eukprot:2719043-Prymnesium_polylepis.1